MKKAIVLSAALLLAGAALFAADDKKPAVKFSGKARAGYVFTFYDGENENAAWKAKEGRLNFHITDADGLWDINMKSLEGGLDGDDKLAAALTVNLSKALNAQGVDTGDLSFGFGIGNKTSDDVLSVYTADDYDYDDFCGQGGYMAYVFGSYAKLASFRLAFSPVNDKLEDKKTVVLSAEAAPVDGVSFTAAFGKNVNNDELAVDANGDDKTDYNWDYGVNGSVNVDIAKLAGLDFQLGVAATDSFVFGNDNDAYDNKTNLFAAMVSGGVDMVNGYVEYGLITTDVDDVDPVHKLEVKAFFNLVEGLGLDAYFDSRDLTDDDLPFTIGADASYKLGGVEYGLNVEFANKYASGKENDGDKVASVSVTPKVTINW